METVRDIVVIVLSVTGTVTPLVLLIICFELYGRTSEALERVGSASDEIHEVTAIARSGERLAKGVFELMGPSLQGRGWMRLAHRGAVVLPKAVRSIARFKRPPVSRPR